MIIPRLVALFFLFVLIDSNSIQRNIRRYNYRQQRSLGIKNWQLVDTLYNHLYKNDNHHVEKTEINKHPKIPLEFRPVEGPINIEQLPAMLAARYVKRYPFSQQADPAVIG